MEKGNVKEGVAFSENTRGSEMCNNQCSGELQTHKMYQNYGNQHQCSMQHCTSHSPLTLNLAIANDSKRVTRSGCKNNCYILSAWGTPWQQHKVHITPSLNTARIIYSRYRRVWMQMDGCTQSCCYPFLIPSYPVLSHRGLGPKSRVHRVHNGPTANTRLNRHVADYHIHTSNIYS